ncbi:hypothetical protein FBALC1_01162 [Flavobacteriales bacterium ALC-1]|nr:hypothetical protein FBALC1_01162 [Flavobacteriales bacterium ALC-1]
MNNFPYTRLIVAASIVIVVFILREPLKELLLRSDKMTFLGSEFTFRKSERAELIRVTDSLEDIIKKQSFEIQLAEIKKDSIDAKFIKWENEINKCDDAKKIAQEIGRDLKDLETINGSIKVLSYDLSKAVHF